MKIPIHTERAFLMRIYLQHLALVERDLYRVDGMLCWGQVFVMSDGKTRRGQIRPMQMRVQGSGRARVVA